MKTCDNPNSTKYYSSRQESYVAKILDGRQTVNSGAGKLSAGDVIVDDAKLLIECKTATKEKESFSIKKDWLSKLKSEAFSKHCENSVLAFNFGNDDRNNFFIISESDFIGYVDYLKGQYKNEN